MAPEAEPERAMPQPAPRSPRIVEGPLLHTASGTAAFTHGETQFLRATPPNMATSSGSAP